MVRTKGLSRLMSLILIFCMTLTLIFAFIPSKAFATGEVDLYHAKIVRTSWYNPPWVHSKATGYVAISNIDNPKSVTIHYTYGYGSWYDVSASYTRTGPDGLEAWYFETMETGGSELSCQFAIKYEVNGQTYWDNNGGNNYSISTSNNTLYLLDKSALALNTASLSSTTFSGNIFLKNLAYNKVVNVRYTTNDWATYSECSASYSSSSGGNVELWNFSTTVPSGSTVKFVISYTVNGVTYWDNNFGANYTVQ